MVELIVGLKEDDFGRCVLLSQIVKESSGKIIRTISVRGEPIAAIVEIPVGLTSQFEKKAHKSGIARYVEPNIKGGIDFVPNDTDWDKQWGPRKIEADHAWNTTTGDSTVLVAVLDTGIDYNHPDLNASYVPLGYDWVNNDNDPMDDDGHGTHCAGIIAATINNSVGMAGLAQVQVMAEKVLNEDGICYASWIANGIYHAIEKNATIISMSFGFASHSGLLYEAIEHAHANGVLLIASAGNDKSDAKKYPAAYNEVIAVTATNQTDSPAYYFPDYPDYGTNFGYWVELAAPGVQIYSTLWDDSYGNASGTSMSAPHVSGVAALIWSCYANWTSDQIRGQLRSSADDLGDTGFDVYYGYGRINARKAVEQTLPQDDVLILWFETTYHVDPNGTGTFNCSILNFGLQNQSNISVQLLANGSVVDSTTIVVLQSGTTSGLSLQWNPVVEGSYNITVYAVPVEGETNTNNNAFSKPVHVRSNIRVPNDYPEIQSAIDHSDPGETIYISPGTYTYYPYYIYIDHPLSLIGEDRETVFLGKSGGLGENHILLVLANNVLISNLTIKNADTGIVAYDSENISITNTTIRNVCVGIKFSIVEDGLIPGNLVKDLKSPSSWYRVSPSYFGIEIENSGNISIESNQIKPNFESSQDPPHPPTDAWGISLASSSNITVEDNLITSMKEAKWCIELKDCSENTIKENMISMGLRPNVTVTGIKLTDSGYNRIYRNSFRSQDEAHILGSSYNNTWDNEEGLEGNFWLFYLFYNGEDLDGDGIGDTAYIIDGNNTDNYPLMNPYFPGDVNHDGTIDDDDIGIIQDALGSTPGDPDWNPHADINEDEKVDSIDMSIAQGNYGKTWRDYWGPDIL